MSKLIAKLYITLPDGQTQEAIIPGYPVIIGKAPTNDIVIADSGISRQHASLRLQDGHYTITDLGSLNGIYVNGKKIAAEQTQVLQDGDRLVMGRVKATFSIEEVASGIIKTDAYETHIDMPGKAGRTSGSSYDTQIEDEPVSPPPTPASPRPAVSVSPNAPPQAPQAPAAPINYRVAMTGELVPRQPAQAAAQEQPKITLDGRYELLERLAQDNTGTTYKARRVMLGDLVAVRVLKPESVNDPVALERFRRQAQVAARIKHPNSVQFYDFGYSDGAAAYIVEELLSGRTLRDVIKLERGMSLNRVVSITNQVAGALHAAHQAGIVLRDLKPESIFVETGSDGHEIFKVGGYGLAKIDQAQAAGPKLTGPLGIFATPQYMSPEQWLNNPLDSRTDVYSLGVIIFELLTGTTPFGGDNAIEISQQHLNAPVPSLADFGRAEIDEDVAAVITRALAKNPLLRQPTAIDLAQELEAVSGSDGGVVGRMINKMTGVLPMRPLVINAAAPAAVTGEAVLPSVVAKNEEKGHGAFNPVVVALMAEACLSRISSGLIKTAVPLYALLVFGMDITAVMALVLIQNIVPLVLRGFFGSLADKYGKKNIFMISLAVRTFVGLLYTLATLPLLFVVSIIRGIADSAKGPSASAMIADATDEKNIAQAYSWYTTAKSTSGGIGEALAAFVLTALIGYYAATQSVVANVATLDKVSRTGKPIEKVIATPTLPNNEFRDDTGESAPVKVKSIEQRTMRLSEIPIDDLPKVVEKTPLRQALTVIFWVSTVFSLLSLLLVAFFIKDKPKEKKDKKKDKPKLALDGTVEQAPNVYAFAFLGAALTAPAYMVTGEFFTLLAVKLEVTTGALGWIKVIAETIVPLVFGPVFGWIADRIGAGKVIALRSIANLITSLLFWIVPSFAGTALLGLMMGIARAVDEIGKAAFKPTWGAISAKVSSFNLANRSKTMGILEGGVDASDLIFPQLAGILLSKLGLGPLMLVRAGMAIIAEIYGHLLMKKYKI